MARPKHRYPRLVGSACKPKKWSTKKRRVKKRVQKRKKKGKGGAVYRLDTKNPLASAQMAAMQYGMGHPDQKLQAAKYAAGKIGTLPAMYLGSLLGLS